MTTALTKLATATPDQVEANLRSQALSRNVELSPPMRLKPRYDESGAFLGSDLLPAPVIAKGSADDLSAFVSDIEASLAPASREAIENWLVELSVICPPRSEDEFTAEVRLAAYVNRLGQVPADIAMEALLVKSWRFFPSWAELDEYISEKRRGRDVMLNACLSELHKRNQPPEKAKPKRVGSARAGDILKEFGFDHIPTMPKSEAGE